MAKNVVNRDVKSAYRPQHQLPAFVGQSNVPLSMSDTQGNPPSVFGVIEDPHPFTTRDNSIHLRPSAKPVSSAALLHDLAPKNAGR